ncbi:MAG: type VI secretion system tube protein TssD [Ignavibacteriales bacterium]|nr:type VI secretion system tube protein TssD [Ignavibacteriales bacterium]
MAVKGEVIFSDDGGSEMPGPRANKSCMVFGFSQQCSLSYQKGSSTPSGSRTYEQFEIVKSIDKLTPLLWKALVEGAILSKVVVTLYEIAEATGSETPYFKYTLEKARIASVKNWMPSSFEAETETVGHLEQINLVSETYTWEHLTASTIHTDEGFFMK